MREPARLAGQVVPLYACNVEPRARSRLAAQGLVQYWDDLGYGRLVGHGGSDLGVASLMALRPDDGVGTVLLTNGNWDTDPDALYDMQARLFEESARF